MTETCEATEEAVVEKLYFHISGDSVTNLARDWLYAENRSFEKVMAFLLSCMHGTDMTTEELTRLAHSVLLGRRKFIGTTRDDSFCLVDDDADLIEMYPMAFKYRDKYEYREEEPEEDRLSFPLRPENDDDLEEDDVERECRYKDYGWLSPEGKFYEVPWAHHSSWAMKYVEEHFTDVDDLSPFFHHDNELRRRGWILLHNPTQGQAILEKGDRQMTKRQKEFLYDYFMERGRGLEANDVWKEE